ELIIYDSDAVIRTFGDDVYRVDAESIARDHPGSYEIIQEATRDNRAFAALVLLDDRVECRIAPPNPDYGFMKLLGRHLGYSLLDFDKMRISMDRDALYKHVLYHEVGHCVDRKGFRNSGNPREKLRYRIRSE